MKKLVFLFALVSFGLNGQGVINNILAGQPGHQHAHPEGEAMPQCGSHMALMDLDRRVPGTKQKADEALQNMVKSLGRNKTASATLTVPVVFHVVYSDSTQNLPDSVLVKQLAALNTNFGRRNADTVNLRAAFEPYAGNPDIQFEFATVDPQGNATNGIVRKSTNITHFGGILPYSISQTALIQQWVNDSLFLNFSRIFADSAGGSDAWDTERYLNIWIGDLRILEPQINNAEELVLLGFARPPANHPNFAGLGLDTLISTVGPVMHHMAIGPDNPTPFPAPYGAFNNILSEGDLLTHEVGHYLALRHIWGDGDCTADDFLFDTPLSNNSNGFTCNKSRNSCVDSIGGVNLPDMVENYMDYSSDACLNSFTQDQAALMRATLYTYYPNLFTITNPEFQHADLIEVYPNPTNGKFRVTSQTQSPSQVELYAIDGRPIQRKALAAQGEVEMELKGKKGVYIVRVLNKEGFAVFRVVKR